MDALVGVLQDSILELLLSLIYINKQLINRTSNSKLLADETSLFSIAADTNDTENQINNDFPKTSQWGCPWEISFYPDPSKQDHEVIFSPKIKIIVHFSLTAAQYNRPYLKSILEYFLLLS